MDIGKNNGHLAQVESWIGTTQEYRQQYTCDSVNRLLRSVEKYGSSLAGTAYDINYRYDAFGNRQQRSADNSGNSTIVQKWVESGDISLTNNRYTSGVIYDAAGNITADPRFRDLLYGYDAAKLFRAGERKPPLPPNNLRVTDISAKGVRGKYSCHVLTVVAAFPVLATNRTGRKVGRHVALSFHHYIVSGGRIIVDGRQ